MISKSNVIMSCTPPHSPRGPKIQQDSWDDCNTPSINLYNPSKSTPPRSPRNSDYFDHPLKSPNASR